MCGSIFALWIWAWMQFWDDTYVYVTVKIADTHVQWCSLMMRETKFIIFWFSNFTNTRDESPRKLTQAKYAVIQSQTVWRCNRVETLCHFQKHVLTLCGAVSLMLRMKDNLPKGTIKVALGVVETAEENSSKSYLSVISWKRLILQRIGENEFESPKLEEGWSDFKIRTNVNLRLMGWSILLDLLQPLILVSVTKRRKAM